MAGRLVARDEEEHELRARLDVGEVTAVDLGLEQPGDEVVAGNVAPRRDQRVDVVGELGVRAGQSLAALVAVERRPRALHHLVGPPAHSGKSSRGAPSRCAITLLGTGIT